MKTKLVAAKQPENKKSITKTKSAQRWWQEAGWPQEHEAGGKTRKQGGTPRLGKDDKNKQVS